MRTQNRWITVIAAVSLLLQSTSPAFARQAQQAPEAGDVDLWTKVCNNKECEELREDALKKQAKVDAMRRELEIKNIPGEIKGYEDLINGTVDKDGNRIEGAKDSLKKDVDHGFPGTQYQDAIDRWTEQIARAKRELETLEWELQMAGYSAQIAKEKYAACVQKHCGDKVAKSDDHSSLKKWLVIGGGGATALAVALLMHHGSDLAAAAQKILTEPPAVTTNTPGPVQPVSSDPRGNYSVNATQTSNTGCLVFPKSARETILVQGPDASGANVTVIVTGPQVFTFSGSIVNGSFTSLTRATLAGVAFNVRLTFTIVGNSLQGTIERTMNPANTEPGCGSGGKVVDSVNGPKF